MKEKPILFSGPMVMAILAGIKTQTRRVVKPQPSDHWTPEVCAYYPTKINKSGEEYPGPETYGATDDHEGRPCPYGKPGEALWVRETFAEDPAPCCDGSCACRNFVYRADIPKQDRKLEAAVLRACKKHGTMVGPWKPSIFMPRSASRITLEVTGIRVERLREISEEDAIAEGIERQPSIRWKGEDVYLDYGFKDSGLLDNCEWMARPKDSYRTLWESINGSGSWNANPWVWVVEFKRVEGGQP